MKSISALPQDSTRLTDRVFDTLCAAIIDGEIPAGSKISEPDLAKRLRVSRASLREAIGRLEACNLVTRKPNVGARVVELNGDQLLEIYHLREALERNELRLHYQPQSTGTADRSRPAAMSTTSSGWVTWSSTS